jgi:uncharacterized membrane protein YfhO
MDRAFVLHKTKAVRNLDEVIRELQGGINFREIGLVTNVTPAAFSRMKDTLIEKADPVGSIADDKVIIKKYGSREIILEVESRGGLLVLSDLYYPGWKVKVNGREEELINVFGLLRGVIIGKGKSEVLFSYHPDSLYAGAAVSAAALVAWIALLTISRHRRKALHGKNDAPVYPMESGNRG